MDEACLGKGSTEKKRFLSGIAQITYPPPWPQFGQLGPLFSEVEIQDLKVSLEFDNTIYTLCILILEKDEK